MAFTGIVNVAAVAQSGTNSPYSRYGLGILSEQSGSYNRGMNGLGFGFYEHNQINYLNPASYSQLDSLTFIFDAGVSGQITNFKEGNVKKNANNADFEYAVAGFRAARHLGVSFGVLPFSSVGYNYSINKYIGENKSASYQNTYKGSGGLHQAYLGIGWMPLKGLSLGANLSYLWGTISRSLTNTYSDAAVNTISKYYSATINNYKLDLGAQYTAMLGKENSLTLGAVYSLGHKLGADLHCDVISTRSQAGVADTAKHVIKNGLRLPETYGAGFVWRHGAVWQVGFDYQNQRWSKLDMPLYAEETYKLVKGQYMDRQKVTIGGDWCPSAKSRSYLKRVHYRIGASYVTPYYKINGQDGPKELSASLGLGLPIMNSWNNRSQLNISAQWVRQEAKGFIRENTFRINVGLTFNERWFAKWKVE